MNEYISRVKRISTTDSLNSEVFNSVIQQLQHNQDVLYNSIALSNRNWNVSELVFGNMMDINSTGEKVFVNGGKFDSIEKILSFSSSLGTISYENNDELVSGGNEIEGEHFLRWDVPQGVTQNVILSRNIAVPEQIRQQNILLGFKLCGFVFNEAITEERFDIYVNGSYVGTGETDIVEDGGLYKFKTIYGNYNLTGIEKNLEVKLIRSSTQTQTQSDYRVRVQNIFVGLNSLGLDQYFLNFPTSPNLDTDINGFYDFDNNSIIPVPKIWTNFNAPNVNSDLTVNITNQPVEIQTEYYVAKDSSGNGLGMDANNKISAEDFFKIESFPASKVILHMDCSETYGAFSFDKGTTYILKVNCGSIHCSDVLISNGSTVDIEVDIPEEDNEISFICTSITAKDKSRLSVDILDDTNKFDFYCNGSIDIQGQSSVEIQSGIFGMPLDQDIMCTVQDHSHLSVILKDSVYQDHNSNYGIGCVIAPINANKYSYVSLDSKNDLLVCHIANGGQDKPVLLKNHSQLLLNGFEKVNTYAKDRTFYAFLHSSIEITSDVEFVAGENCDSAFDKIELALFSSFGAKTIPDNVTRELVESFVYELD